MSAAEWLSDQFRLHTELNSEACTDFATYTVNMDDATDVFNFLTSLLSEVSQNRVQKIHNELLRRRGAMSAAQPAAPSAKSPIWVPSATSSAPLPRHQKKRGLVISSNTGQRKDMNSFSSTTAASTTNDRSSSKEKSTISSSSSAEEIANPFLMGGPPAKFVTNCLKCGQIIW
jgi:hypothetical protein